MDLEVELKQAAQIIKDRVYFVPLSSIPTNTPSRHFFCIDGILRYEPFFTDFGPLNLACTYRFCEMLKQKLEDPKLAHSVIYYYCSTRPQHKSNAAVLIGAYQVIYMNRTPQEAYEPLQALEPYMPFRDASQGPCTFRLTPYHCIRAFMKAQRYRFFDFATFNAEEYEHFEQVENGDLNIIVPGKFLAFSGPHGTRVDPNGYPTLTPADYIPIFKIYDVKGVIRLNKKCYDRKDFINQGLDHHELFFIDGTTPSQQILDRFIEICESTPGTLAVHCKAGLGRTGTTIGCYMMKHFRLTAAETIAWIRICRPGSVIGPQQQFLKMQEPRMWKLGKSIRAARRASESGMDVDKKGEYKENIDSEEENDDEGELKYRDRTDSASSLEESLRSMRSREVKSPPTPTSVVYAGTSSVKSRTPSSVKIPSTTTPTNKSSLSSLKSMSISPSSSLHITSSKSASSSPTASISSKHGNIFSGLTSSTSPSSRGLSPSSTGLSSFRGETSSLKITSTRTTSRVKAR